MARVCSLGTFGCSIECKWAVGAAGQRVDVHAHTAVVVSAEPTFIPVHHVHGAHRALEASTTELANGVTTTVPMSHRMYTVRDTPYGKIGLLERELHCLRRFRNLEDGDGSCVTSAVRCNESCNHRRHNVSA